MIFYDGQELRRDQKAALRMQPADQCLRTHNLAGTQVYFGLVIEYELVGSEGLANALDAFRKRSGMGILCVIEELIAVLAGCAGTMHRMSGLAQKFIGIGVLFLRVAGDADGGRKANRNLSGFDCLSGSMKKSLERRNGGQRIVEIEHERGKGISVQTRQSVASAQGSLHIASHAG